MAKWRRLLQPPAGALPGNLVTKVGVGVIAVLLAGLVLSRPGDGPEAPAAGGGEPAAAGEGTVGQILSRLGRLEDQQLIDAAARAGTADTDAAGSAPGPPPSGHAAGRSGAEGGLPTAGEMELRERLRLEAIERRARSLRAPSVVWTFRSDERPGIGNGRPETEGGSAEHAPDATVAARSLDAGTPGLAPAVPASGPAVLADRMEAANELLSGLAGAGPAAAAPARAVPGVTGPPVGRTADPAVVSTPDDPAGWERVYEGSVLSAVLVTQLDGDFTGPVLAQVAIPFYSADRQRILVPRGARLVGSAQAVEQQDQGRLAVGFHRLVWPDGRWVDLAFHGLNGIGESALADQVDRHYPSTFAAAGAVGLLAGLTLQGSDPYAGGGAGFRAAAGQGFGQSATRILGRFLNRLPTVTVRAGHRLRVWVTSDFLVPRPEPHPEAMFR